MLQGIEVELKDMLACREARAARQQQWLQLYQNKAIVLISFSLNIPGPVKTNPVLHKVFEEGVKQIQEALFEKRLTVLEVKLICATTGDEGLWAVVGIPKEIKISMQEIEESHQLGRLFDIDVLDSKGEKLSRTFPRRCLICGEQAQACARSRRHSVEELGAAVEKLLNLHN